MRTFASVRTFVAGLLLAGLGYLGTPDTSRADSLLLTGAVVHTVTGDTLTNGQVLVRDGKIAAVGPNLTAAGVPVVDLSGQHLYPGMIVLNTVVGLTEIGAIRATQDASESGDYTPDVESWVAVNPDSELLPVTRANGVAFFQPVPTGGIVAGQSGLVAAAGWTTEQMVINRHVALDVFWPSMNLDTQPGGRGRGRGPKAKSLGEQAKERVAKLRELNEFFEEARAYARAREASAKAGSPSLESIPAWEAMIPYVKGELPLMIHADEPRQITAAVEWAATNHYRMVLAGGRDAWMVAGLLASNQVPVVYADTFSMVARDTEPYDVHFRAAAVLHQAGVKVAFGLDLDTMSASLAKNLPCSAAQAVAFGLAADEALKGLTLYPAQIAGVAERLGSIDIGKDATLFASDGDILGNGTHVTHLWFAGKEVSLESRHTRFYDKYRNRPRN